MKEGIEDSLLLDFEDNGDPPAVKTYPHQRSLTCYGRGRSLSEIEMPRLPGTLNNLTSTPTEGGKMTKSGRGRGKRTPASATVNDNTSQHSSSHSHNSLQEITPQRNGSTRSKSPDNNIGVISNNSGKYWSNLLQAENTVLATSPHAAHQHPSHEPVESNDTTANYYPPANDLQWRVMSPDVCQLEGIPLDMDLNVIHDLLSSYGTIVDWERKEHNDCVALRVKFDNPVICSQIEANLDQSDFSGTGSMVRCKHLKT